MSPPSKLISGLVAAALTMTAAPAFAKAEPGAAHKLALTGVQGASACVGRTGVKGTWRQDVHGNWIPCNAASSIGGSSTWLLLGAVAVVVGGILLLNDDDDNTPSSP